MSHPSLLEGFVEADQLAADLNKHPRTIGRWMDRPDGLPFVKLGRKRLVHIETAHQWLLGRMRRPNPTRRKGAAA
jgi:hypothetical protein